MPKLEAPLQLLPRDALMRTGPVDFAEWNSKLVLGWIMRQRFRMALSLIDNKVGRLLEVGYGSGVFMPALAQRCGELWGIDIHPHVPEVTAALSRANIVSRLFQGSADALPFGSAMFDVVVAVSSLEFVLDLPAAVSEFARVLAPLGSLVVITPAHSPITDAGLLLLTGKKAEDDFEGRRDRVIPTLLERFEIDRIRKWPTRVLPFYTGLRLKRQDDVVGGSGGRA